MSPSGHTRRKVEKKLLLFHVLSGRKKIDDKCSQYKFSLLMQISHSATKVGFNWICAHLCIWSLAGYKLRYQSGWILNSASGQAGYPTTGYLVSEKSVSGFCHHYLVDIWPILYPGQPYSIVDRYFAKSSSYVNL